MTTGQAAGVGWDDRLNPVVVKELRQAMRGRFIPVLLIAYLLWQLFMMTVFLANVRAQSTGISLVMSFLSALVFTILVLVPLGTGVRVAMEHGGTDKDLMFVSTLTPREVVWGKFMAGFVVQLLFFFATLPFLAMTFFLRGVDLPSLFYVGLVVLGMAAWMLAATLTVALLPVSRVLRILLGVGGLVFLVMVMAMCLAIVGEMLDSGLGSRLVRGELWLETAGGAAVWLVVLWILTRASETLLQPVSANRMLPLRLALTVGGAVVLLPGVFFPNYLDGAVPLWTMVVACAACLSVCERGAYNPRLLRAVPAAWGRRLAVFPFFTGNANGLVWCLLWFVILACFYPFLSSSDATMNAGIALYATAYAATSHGLYRWTALRRLPGRLAFLIPVGLFVLTSLGVFVVLFLLHTDSWDRGYDAWFLLNPFILGNSGWRDEAAVTAGIWAAGALTVHLPFLVARFRAFKPPAPKPEAAP